MATGSDGNLNGAKSELVDLEMLSKSSKCPSLPAGSIALVKSAGPDCQGRFCTSAGLVLFS